MTYWLILPRDPLIFRDGRPFTAIPGSRATTLAFPFPSTLAGATRTMAGTDASNGDFDKSRIAELMEKKIRGPVLVRLNERGEFASWLFPAPADSVLFKTKDDLVNRRHSLSPISDLSKAKTDLQNLKILGFSSVVKDKPNPKPPRFWYWEKYQDWLESPMDGELSLKDLGISGPKKESRAHVSIAPETQTGLPGALFQTSGLEFAHHLLEDGEIINLSQLQTLGMVVDTDNDLRNELGFLGGERRIVQWEHTGSQFPSCPDVIKQHILGQKRCRLILLTPAYFEYGYQPNWLLSLGGAQASIQAVAIPRYQTVSGWDYQLMKPKPTRRLAPAGSVYFLEFKGEKVQIQDFIDSVWMQNVSDEEQDRRDGFGLAVLGTWNTESRKMEM
jgi:CRISPR-associated protein Cmr3